MRDLLREPETMRDVLRRRLLRGACSAVSWLIHAANGHVSARSDDQFRAAALLAKLAPQLAGDPIDRPWRFDGPEYWTPKRVIMLEIAVGHHMTREQCALWWGNCFCHHGPRPPHYSTLEEARAYGAKRWDSHEGIVPDVVTSIGKALETFERGEILK
jgi:hypothetical protein